MRWKGTNEHCKDKNREIRIIMVRGIWAITSSTALSSNSAMAANEYQKEHKEGGTWRNKKREANYTYKLKIPPKAHLCEVAFE